MPETWSDALDRYKYVVKLSEFCGERWYRNYFTNNPFAEDLGDRQTTKNFETYFRKRCGAEIEPWFEVVFWKMYSQKNVRDSQTCNIIRQFSKSQIMPKTLFEAVNNFMDSNDKRDAKTKFEHFLHFFYPDGKNIAIVATFPSFINPDMFPMVDTRVAKWVNYVKDDPDLCNSYDNGISKLSTTTTKKRKKLPPLQLRDFDFYWNWIQWCREYAKKLTLRTQNDWRPRDVEMAVFTAWGGITSKKHPEIDLTPI